MFNIFLSSSIRDLELSDESVLTYIEEKLQKMEIKCYKPNRETSQKVNIASLRRSDVAIFFVSPYYSSLIDNCEINDCIAMCPKQKGNIISSSQCEYEVAISEDIPHMTYLIDKNWDILESLKEYNEGLGLNIGSDKKYESLDESYKQNYLLYGMNALNFKEKLNKENFGKIPDFFDPKNSLLVLNHLEENVKEWYIQNRISFPNFYGRKKEIKEIIDNLDKKVEVYGIGGVGKSKLVDIVLLLQKIKGKKVISVGLGHHNEKDSSFYYTNRNNDKQHFIVDNHTINIYHVLEAMSELVKNIEDIEKNKEDKIISIILNVIKENNVLLFIDDFQNVNESVINLVKKLDNIIIASRKLTGLADKEVFLTGIQEEFRENLVNRYCKLLNVDPDENIKKKIQNFAEGHPLSTQLLLRNIDKIIVENIDELNLKYIDINQVREYSDHVFKQILSTDALSILGSIAVIDTELDYNLEREIVEEIYNFDNISALFNELVDTEMLKKKEGKEGIYDFTFKHLKSFLKNMGNKSDHLKAIEYYSKKQEDFTIDENFDNQISYHKMKINSIMD